MTGTAAEDVVAKHAGTLERALAAISERGHWSAFPESPSPRVYGEGAAEAGKAAYEAHLGRRFELDQAGTVGWVGAERSPYGPELGISYPQADLDVLLAAAQAAIPAWRDAGPRVRAAVCVEIVERVNARSFEIANAVMHTSGQAFVMAFQAGGPHAQDRALEAVAYAYAEQTRVPATARWEKPQGKRPALVMDKTYTVVPRGVGAGGRLHHVPDLELLPRAVRQPGHRQRRGGQAAPGGDPAAGDHRGDRAGGAGRGRLRPRPGHAGRRGARRPGRLAAGHPAGGAGRRLHRLDRVRRLAGGQRPAGAWSTPRRPASTRSSSTRPTTTPGCWRTSPSPCLSTVDRCAPRRRTCWCRADGIATDAGRKSVDELGRRPRRGDRPAARRGRPGRRAARRDRQRRRAVPGGRCGRARRGGRCRRGRWRTRPSRTRGSGRRRSSGCRRGLGRVRGRSASARSPSWSRPTPRTRAWSVFRRTVGARGALTASVYSTDEKVVERAREAALDAGVALSENLTGGVYVNQSAAFSDFHATGANPAANAAFTDAALRRRPVPGGAVPPAPPGRLISRRASPPAAARRRRAGCRPRSPAGPPGRRSAAGRPAAAGAVSAPDAGGPGRTTAPRRPARRAG